MLFLKEQAGNTLWGIWKIEEPEEELFSMLDNPDNKAMLEKEFADIKSEVKVTERLAVNVLLKNLLGHEAYINHYESGKPYIGNGIPHISISHTKGYVAVSVNPDKATGIDIQYITEKIKRVRNRFVREDEYIDPDNELIDLLIIWCTKETLYKVFGYGADFRESFYVKPFHSAGKGHVETVEKITGTNKKFNLSYMVTPDFILTHTT